MKNKKRHIEISVISVKDNIVSFKIKEQTHKLDDFTNTGCSFTASNGIILQSCSYPALMDTTSVIFVQGDDIENSDMVITDSCVHFAELMEAITEYNETDGNGYKQTYPNFGDKYWFVTSMGTVNVTKYRGSPDDIERNKVGNYFKTGEEANIMSEKFKKILKEDK